MAEPDDLKQRIEAARDAQKPKVAADTTTGTASGAAAALGHSIGLVVALILGAAIGYFIDTALGTAPFALLIFLVLGAIAGFLNIIRAGQQMAAKAQAEQDARDASD
ncbi:MAG: AtpZ/AtpI family protein [Pseudomonadota bacterium]